MARKYTRYEINQFVKSALVRNAVDLSVLNFSCTEQTVYLNGELKKDPRGDFTRQQILAMVRELESLPVRLEVVFDLTNWLIVQRYGSWEISQSKKVSSGPAREEKPLIIKDEGSIDQLLLDMIKADSDRGER